MTDSHIEELSLCALFLMSAAKKVDKEFSCQQSSAHTVSEAKKDIDKILLENIFHQRTLLRRRVEYDLPIGRRFADKGGGTTYTCCHYYCMKLVISVNILLPEMPPECTTEHPKFQFSGGHAPRPPRKGRLRGRGLRPP